LANFRLYDGSSEFSPTANYSITDGETGFNLKTVTVPAATTTLKVVVTFNGTNEQSISGSGKIYTLRATLGSSSATGNNANTSIHQDPAGTTVARAYLVNNVALTDAGGIVFKANTNVFQLDTGTGTGQVDGAANKPGTFLWSDNSEAGNHSATTQTSFDWTNDVLVEDLSQSAVVSN
jgi:hypothetical protein